MKKLVVIGSCCALAILIMGMHAFSKQGEDQKSPSDFLTPVSKCVESVKSNSLKDSSCDERQSELFLRPLPKRERKAYALL